MGWSDRQSHWQEDRQPYPSERLNLGQQPAGGKFRHSIWVFSQEMRTVETHRTRASLKAGAL